MRDQRVDPLADPHALRGLLDEITTRSAKLDHRLTIMEVCGTHTHSVAKAGLRSMLPPNVRLVSGPGCPVCVTPVGYLDRAIALAHLPDTLVCTFGDLMRVPSSSMTLEQASAQGASVRIVYSPRDAVNIAKENPSKRIIFLSVGFETTVPTIAAALSEAESSCIDNFLILPGNKIMPPPMRALAGDPELEVGGFLLPGHVSVILGSDAFSFLTDELNCAGVIVGFAPSDVLRGVNELVKQRIEGRHEVNNLYCRVVSREGNQIARELVDRFFEAETVVWRGFGEIPGSGLRLRTEWKSRDASTIAVEVCDPIEPVGCRCGDVLRGTIDPPDCPLFGSPCTPADPVGACMVSNEGSCAAWYRHEGSR